MVQTTVAARNMTVSETVLGNSQGSQFKAVANSIRAEGLFNILVERRSFRKSLFRLLSVLSNLRRAQKYPESGIWRGVSFVSCQLMKGRDDKTIV